MPLRLGQSDQIQCAFDYVYITTLMVSFVFDFWGFFCTEVRFAILTAHVHNYKQHYVHQ